MTTEPGSVALAAGDWAVTIDPARGASVTRLVFAGQDLLADEPAFWMIPWANRLDGGRLGQHRLPVNRPQDGTAIHGLSRDRPWQVAAQAPDSATLAQEVDAAPYRYAARLGVAVTEDAFTIDLAIINTGAEAMSFGAGWHPWFRRPPGTRLMFRATHRCRHDARTLPVAADLIHGFSGGEEAFLGLDTHFTGWDGMARIAWPGLALTLEATGALATNLQVYAPRDRPVLCVEPCSHLPDAPNRPDLADLGPMRRLAPGEILTGRIILSAECSHLP
ncbi:aldose epimerase [Neoroseomonas rubea]|uniref:aldose epimerase family protein n=1 Tax=Neoroseomonas rubea TaxID=2748666 RepID=UPI0018DFCEE1|nr:aldose epimerase [Roseomonas rubea]